MEELQLQNAGLTDRINQLDKEKSELSEKVTQLEQTVTNKENDLIRLESELKSLIENNQKLNQDLQETTQKAESLETQLQQFADLRDRIEKALGCTQNEENSIFSSIESYKTTIIDKSNEIKGLTELLNSANAEISRSRKYEQILIDIKENSEKFKDEPWGNENLALIFPPEFKPFFDLEFLIPQGERISCQDENDWLIRGDINKFTNDLRIQSTFCMIGGSQTGKTFLLSKLSGIVFGFGKKFPTDCVKFRNVEIQGVKLLSIDTPGIHRAANFSGIDFDVEELQDLVMSNVVTGLSNTIIFVVNNFNIHEQKLLVQFSKKEEYKKKKFIIVHNFKEVYDENELNEAWTKQVIELYGEDFNNHYQSKLVTITVENELKSKNIPIFCPNSNFRHVGLVNNNYKFGKEYNLFSIEYIKNVLVYEMIGKKVKNFKLQMANILEDLIGAETEINKLTRQDDEEPELSKVSFKSYISLEQIKFRNFSWLTTEETSKRNIGMLLDDDEFIINIDVPGISFENILISCTNYSTSVSAKGEKNKSRLTRNTSKFHKDLCVNFTVPKEFDHMNPTAELMNGTLIISYKRQITNQVALTSLRDLEKSCEKNLLFERNLPVEMKKKTWDD